MLNNFDMDLCVILVLWVSLAILVGWIGSYKKIGFLLSFVLGLLLTPIISLAFTVASPSKEEDSDSLNFSTGLYILGGIFLLIALCYLLQANTFLFGTAKIFGTEYGLMMKEYVGGDAYNFIIAGTYSTTLTVRALIFTVLSCTSVIVGKLNSSKK